MAAALQRSRCGRLSAAWILWSVRRSGVVRWRLPGGGAGRGVTGLAAAGPARWASVASNSPSSSAMWPRSAVNRYARL
jgi:phage baseplate assembly protein gpV